MRYRVDEALCSGHGQCYTLAPEVFSADADGFNTAVGVTVDVLPDHGPAARAGAGACPEQAIQLQV